MDRTDYAKQHPDGAIDVCDVAFHANELVYAHRTDPSAWVVECHAGCEWSEPFADLPVDEATDGGYVLVPPLCPACLDRGEFEMTRTRRRGRG